MTLFKGNVIIPQININGTNGDQLVAEAEAAYDALIKAVNAVENMTVHGRDFQTCAAADTVTSKARNEHRERLMRLRGIKEDVSDILTGLIEQKEERKQ
jgi:hypothetical protein